MKYIHQLKIWPKFTWDTAKIALAPGKVRNRQGRLMGRMEALGFSLRSEAVLKTLKPIESYFIMKDGKIYKNTL
ncbi:MAG: DUF4172 domain-containing protein [Planctomycetes bacterium]|nr:DUF4172 domain-containing protein [Planctomycetota bacterium]